MNRCPRCQSALAPRDDIGPGVLGSDCGAFFVVDDARKKLLSWLHVSEDTWAFVLSQGRKGPPCACGQTMTTAALKGVEVDGCSACGGLLLDAGELRKLTGLDEGTATTTPAARAATPIARVELPERDDGSLGRVFAPSRAALDAFACASRRFHLLQVKSSPAPGVMNPINEPFEWTVSNGLTVGTITSYDDSIARQLLAFVTANLVSSRFLLRDGRDNPLLVFVRTTRGLLNAAVEARFADDDALIGTVSMSIGGYSIDCTDTHDRAVLHLARNIGLFKRLSFTLSSSSGEQLGDVARQFGNVEIDNALLGAMASFDRSLHREDFELTLANPLPLAQSALALASLFLIAQSSHGALT